MEERHRCVVTQGAGGEAAVEFGQHVLGHGMRVGERLRADLDPYQLHQFGVGVDHAFDAMGDAGSISGEEAGVEAADAAGRGDRARDQEQARRIRQQARLRERLPGAFELDGFFDLASKAQPGLLAGFTDRGNRQRARAGWRDLRTTLQKVGLELRGNGSGDGNAVV